MAGLSKKDMEKIGDAWDRITQEQRESSVKRQAWWHSEQIIQHMNYNICGKDVGGDGTRGRLSCSSNTGAHLITQFPWAVGLRGKK